MSNTPEDDVNHQSDPHLDSEQPHETADDTSQPHSLDKFDIRRLPGFGIGAVDDALGDTLPETHHQPASLFPNRYHSLRHEGLLGMLNPAFHERKPSVDGSEFVEKAFGGFGPESPEYQSGSRLTISIPDSAAAVKWFEKEVEAPDHAFMNMLGGDSSTKSFRANIPASRHPGIQSLEITFSNRQTALISGSIIPARDALSVRDAPEMTDEGARIDTATPARKMLHAHLQARLASMYPDKLELSIDAEHISVNVEPGIDLHIDCSPLPNLEVTVNGQLSYPTQRYGDLHPTPEKLESELLALQKYFPAIAEAYAEFFRKQLPITTIEVDYAQTSANRKHRSRDLINPGRQDTLREELLITPDEEDFKYIGGLDGDIARLQEAAVGFTHPDAFHEFGVKPPRGILLVGPPGVGKTSLAMAFAHGLGAEVLSLKHSVIKSALHGETERNIRGAFLLVDELLAEGKKVVVFIDELEALAAARDAFTSSSVDQNVTTEILQAMNEDRPGCVFVGATNLPHMVDRALINNSIRFSEKLIIDLPDVTQREDILEKLFCKFTDHSKSQREDLFDATIQIDGLAQTAETLSGADMENAIRKVLFTKAVMLAQTGQKPGPATHSEIYQSLQSMLAEKEKTSISYL